jgi:hypothetical protein
MDIERDVGLVVAHLPSLCDLNSRSITPTVSSPARLRAMARSPTSLRHVGVAQIRELLYEGVH